MTAAAIKKKQKYHYNIDWGGSPEQDIAAMASAVVL